MFKSQLSLSWSYPKNKFTAIFFFFPGVYNCQPECESLCSAEENYEME